MQSLLVLIIHLWAFTALVLYLHHRSPRFGFAPMLMLLGALVAITQSTGSIVVTPFPGLRMIVNSYVLVPIVIIAALVIYVTSGSTPARWFIIGLVLVSCVVLFTMWLYTVYLSLPDAFSFNTDLQRLFTNRLALRTTAASIVTFAADMFIIVVVYQGLRNAFIRLPETVVVSVALLAAIACDVILFNLLAWIGTPNFSRLVPGDLVGKLTAGLAAAPLVALYLGRFAPRLPQYMGARGRRLFDIVSPDMRRLTRELQQTRRALTTEQAHVIEERARVQLMRDFIGEVSHDLKNPLTSINLRLSMIAHARDDAQRAAMLKEVKDLSLRMSTIIDDLMILARLENETARDIQPVDPELLIEGGLARLKAQIDAKRLKCTVTTQGDKALMAADVLDLTRAFDNLLGNAVHYTPEGGAITITIAYAADGVRIEFTDSGIGIPQSEIGRVFDRFYRASNARRAVESGTGLGLPIVQKVVAHHGGTVGVQSEVGIGTTFTMTLPYTHSAGRV